MGGGPRISIAYCAALLEAGRDQLVRDVRAGNLDLAAVFDFPALGLRVDDGLEARRLLEEPHALVLHPEHRLARRRKVAMADLRDEDWLFPTLGPDSPTQKLFTAACAAAGYEPRIVFRVNDCEMFQGLVAAGVGIGFLPRLALHPVHPHVVIKPVAALPGEESWPSAFRACAPSHRRLSSGCSRDMQPPTPSCKSRRGPERHGPCLRSPSGSPSQVSLLRGCGSLGRRAHDPSTNVTDDDPVVTAKTALW